MIWLEFNQGKCNAHRWAWIYNRAPMVLGTAYNKHIRSLIWGLWKP